MVYRKLNDSYGVDCMRIPQEYQAARKSTKKQASPIARSMGDTGGYPGSRRSVAGYAEVDFGAPTTLVVFLACQRVLLRGIVVPVEK